MFWKRFFSLCAKNNKTPNGVCAELGLSTATATHWKNGVLPKSDLLVKIANYFNCSTDYLLGRTEQPDNKSNLELNALFQSLNADNQKKLTNYAKELERQQQVNSLLVQLRQNNTISGRAIADGGETKNIKITPKQQELIAQLLEENRKKSED